FEKNHSQRFFVWLHLYDPHEPYRAPRRFREKFKGDRSGLYDAEIAFTDEAVGKIVEALKSRGLLENTLVVIVGDHGEAFGEHNEYGHGIFCYDEALKVPLIFYNPQLLPRQGLRVKNRVNLVDIMPTLLEMYGMEIPSSIQGQSVVPLLAGEEEEGRRMVYFESMHGKDEMN
ncbi:MAG: sulfatase-like hydrolase/transferase, partial [bacterium]|nr:sulfatase-like hydrolase/transferase [bacterium]